MKRTSCSPCTEWCQLDSRPSRVSPHPAKTVSPSSSCPASTIKRAQLPASPWHSLVEPSLVLSLLTLPPPLQGSESFDVHVAAWQGQEDKTLLVPSLYNKTFGNLEGHRDKRLGFFSFFLFFFSNNKWWFVFTSCSFRATPASKSMKSAKSQGRGDLAHPVGNSPAHKTNRVGEGALCAVCPTGVI